MKAEKKRSFPQSMSLANELQLLNHFQTVTDGTSREKALTKDE
jgi:hypothetical protein